MKPVYNTAAGSYGTPAYAGNRVRVLKKTRVYTSAPGTGSAIVWGDQFSTAGAPVQNRLLATGFDLYTTDGATEGAPVVAAANPPLPYTVLASITPPPAGPYDPATTPNTLTQLSPMFYEPAHLRGRAMATFSNSPAPSVNGQSNSQSYLLGDVASTNFNNSIYVQGIRYVYPTSVSIPPAVIPSQGPIPFYPVLQSGNTASIPGARGTATTVAYGIPSSVPVEAHTNPLGVPQQSLRNGTAMPNLYVGDSRPHKVIFREGHLYDARVVYPITPTVLFNGNLFNSTVTYDIVQKLSAAQYPLSAFTAKWQNTNAFAPMFDVPANVVRYGEANPINLFPYLEKLFVSTTFPALAGTPDASFAASDGGDPRSRDDSSSPKTQLPTLANCYSNATTPGVNSVSTFGVNQVSFVTAGADANKIKLTVASNNFASGTTVTIPAPGLVGQNGTIVPAGSYAVIASDADNFFLGTTAAPGTAIVLTAATTAAFPYNGAGFVTLSTPAGTSWGSLYDMRCGEDGYDSAFALRDPNSGGLVTRNTYTIRGSATTDPNDGSIWAFGAYARRRLATFTRGQWGTFAANYKLGFPDTDPYGNTTASYTDIAGLPEAPYIEIARRNGIVPPSSSDNLFRPEQEVKRREMARWIVKSQMDEDAITNYLSNTASIGNGSIGLTSASFADVPASDPDFRYIEVMARRGYTSGCAAGVARRYCPEDITTRKDMAVFIIPPSSTTCSRVFSAVAPRASRMEPARAAVHSSRLVSSPTAVTRATTSVCS